MFPRYKYVLDDPAAFHQKIAYFEHHYEECRLCPHECGVNRARGERGQCRSGIVPVVASHTVHHGEEPPISGSRGSGTIFFSGCTGQCCFCQNYPISQLCHGEAVSTEKLAHMMLSLERRGVHNINLVTPTHYLPSFVSALFIAAKQGLTVPIVYNTSGYERDEVIAALENIIDIYLPDAKYADNGIASELSGFRQYVEHNRSSLRKMYEQVGTMKIHDGIARSGMIVRHLILPENVSGTDDVLNFIASGLSKHMHVSLMDQYFPAYTALEHPVLSRRITGREYETAVEWFGSAGLHNGWIQEHQ